MAKRSVPRVQASKPHKTDDDFWRDIFPKLSPAKPWKTPGGFTYSDERLPIGSWWKAKDVNGHDMRIFVAGRKGPGVTKSRLYLKNVVTQYKPDGYRFMLAPGSLWVEIFLGVTNPMDE